MEETLKVRDEEKLKDLGRETEGVLSTERRENGKEREGVGGRGEERGERLLRGKGRGGQGHPGGGRG